MCGWDLRRKPEKLYPEERARELINFLSESFLNDAGTKSTKQVESIEGNESAYIFTVGFVRVI